MLGEEEFFVAWYHTDMLYQEVDRRTKEYVVVLFETEEQAIKTLQRSMPSLDRSDIVVQPARIRMPLTIHHPSGISFVSNDGGDTYTILPDPVAEVTEEEIENFLKEMDK